MASACRALRRLNDGTPPPEIGQRWRDRLIFKCQVLAGRALDAHGRLLVRELRELVVEIPPNATIADRLFIRVVLGQTLGQVGRLTNAAERSDMVRAFLTWMTSNAVTGEWQSSLTTLIDEWATALDEPDSAPLISRRNDRRVGLALELLDARYKDAALTLHALAAETNLSVWHASRLLKLHTGHGFRAHLHRRRVAAAQRLLAHTTMTVKEIAGAVGYESSTQLDRHFKRLCGTTPVAMREATSNAGRPSRI